MNHFLKIYSFEVEQSICVGMFHPEGKVFRFFAFSRKHSDIKTSYMLGVRVVQGMPTYVRAYQ